MSTPECVLRYDLSAFVDGELRGASVLEILQHLDKCPSCAAEVAQLRALGETIRGTTIHTEPLPPELDGLASTVISRTRAEAAESWLGVLRRAREDWHWAIVGAGSIAATFVSTVALSAILAFGPKPDRADSISAFYTRFRAPAVGEVYLLASPVGQDQEPRWVDENGGPVASARAVQADWFVTRARAEARAEADAVGALQDAVMVHGQMLAFDQMSPERRKLTESLLAEISRYRITAPVPPGVPLKVHEVRFETSASVTAKGL